MSDDTTGTSADGPPPTRVGDRYELGELLGRGGMAEVRRAIDTRLNRPVAVKQLRFDLAGDSVFQARFRREAQAAAGLNHPTIVAVYDTGEESDPQHGTRIPYIVMELVEGVTLRDVLRDGRKILPERALELSSGVLDALSYSHRAGIVHRDIKPANVMLTPAGDIKVMDFGIARAVADTTSTMTQTAAVIGTAQYLSPEQARGETVDARSDIYSAGCLLYELLVGRPPFIGESPVSVAYQHVREEPLPPSEHDPEVTPGMDAVVMRALAKDPHDRYQSARQMKDDLQRLLNGQEPLAAAALPASSPTPSDLATAVLVPDRQPSPYGAGGSEATKVTEPVMVPAAADAVAEPEDEEEEPRRTGAIIALVTLLVLAAIAVGLAIWWVNSNPQTGTTPPSSAAPSPTVQLVEVPSVITQTQEQATNTLKGLGLEVEVDEVSGEDDSSVGQVTDQDPAARTSVEVGETVTITVNVGPKKTEIPDGLVGKTEDQAKAVLKDVGFSKVTTEDAESEDPGTKKGTVLAVRPTEGSEVALGTEIVLEVATGQGPVPDLDGMDENRAKQEAEDAGFEVEFVEQEVEGGNNTVIKQSPGRGKKADWGSTIKATIGVPKPEETTPPPPTSPGGEPTDESSGDPTGEPTGSPTDPPS